VDGRRYDDSLESITERDTMKTTKEQERILRWLGLSVAITWNADGSVSCYRFDELTESQANAVIASEVFGLIDDGSLAVRGRSREAEDWFRQQWQKTNN
jgi:hypothetical protein